MLTGGEGNVKEKKKRWQEFPKRKPNGKTHHPRIGRGF